MLYKPCNSDTKFKGVVRTTSHSFTYPINYLSVLCAVLCTLCGFPLKRFCIFKGLHVIFCPVSCFQKKYIMKRLE